MTGIMGEFLCGLLTIPGIESGKEIVHSPHKLLTQTHPYIPIPAKPGWLATMEQVKMIVRPFPPFSCWSKLTIVCRIVTFVALTLIVHYEINSTSKSEKKSAQKGFR
jgi:hypothetical protein